jgi:hypothetical protein
LEKLESGAAYLSKFDVAKHLGGKTEISSISLYH